MKEKGQGIELKGTYFRGGKGTGDGEIPIKARTAVGVFDRAPEG